MQHSIWKGTLAAFTVGFIGGCAPTSLEADVVMTSAELSICGNGACDVGETCASCPGDCGRCTQAHCGDGTCGRKESCVTCVADCGVCSGCGNGVCSDGETCASCAKDCGRCSGDFCGNGTCGRRESCTSCARDCCPGGTGGGSGGGTGGGSGGGTGGGGGMAACASADDCPATGNECILAVCDNGQCSTTNQLSGTPLVDQVEGDCRDLYCNGGGGTLELTNDADLPIDDGNECTTPVCTMGMGSYEALPAGTVCTGGTCSGAGNCVTSECTSAADCPPSMGECVQPACVAGACAENFTAQGTPTMQQMSGDCLQQVCDGMGSVTTQVDAADVLDDGNECTTDLCTMSGPVNVPSPVGTPCEQNGGTQCDGVGACISPQ